LFQGHKIGFVYFAYFIVVFAGHYFLPLNISSTTLAFQISGQHSRMTSADIE